MSKFTRELKSLLSPTSFTILKMIPMANANKIIKLISDRPKYFQLNSKGELSCQAKLPLKGDYLVDFMTNIAAEARSSTCINSRLGLPEPQHSKNSFFSNL